MADYGVYTKRMKAIYDSHKCKVLCDSAFKLASVPYIIKSSQQENQERKEGFDSMVGFGGTRKREKGSYPAIVNFYLRFWK